MLLFYDFEVFSSDWLVVFKEITGDNEQETVIVNDKIALEAFHAEHKSKIWIGYNSRHYDQYILKAILCDFNPKKVSDWIINKGRAGWEFSSLFNKIPLNNYDVSLGKIDRGLKMLEGFMGNAVKESSVPFDIDRPLTEIELQEIINYCRYDVDQTMEIFLAENADGSKPRLDEFNAHMGLVKIASGSDPLQLHLISKTKPQLSALILGAERKQYKDEFDIDFPPTLRVEKYTRVLDWYSDPNNRKYKVDPENPKSANHNLETIISGVPHVFGWGGIHGATPKYNGKGFYLNIDVASYYPTLMIEYGLASRSIKNPVKFEEIYRKRLEYKRDKNPLQSPLKLVLNSTYGAMKDNYNALFDPLQNNKVCVYGQLFLLDLMERLEPHCQIIQSNTDGVLIKMPSDSNQDEWFYLIDDVCYEWEQRTRLTLEFEEFHRVFQKDVNAYLMVNDETKVKKSKNQYVKELSVLDYDLPIVKKALVAYMVYGVPVEETIGKCNELKEFQLLTKISNKYVAIYHGDTPLKEKCIRLFASKDPNDAGLTKLHTKTGNFAKVSNSPPHCFIWNDDVNGVKAPQKLDKQFYVDMAIKRLADFGVK